jgi:GntR family histidine utilization transcriptional repressor
VTLDRRIRGDIEARIRSGEWAPGYRIPFEHELMAQYDCSRATVGKALAVLVAAGLVERRRRAGSFVARPRVQSAVLEIPDIAAVVAARGEAYGFELGARRVRPGDPDVALEAELSDGGPILVIDGRHLANGQPLALEHRLLNLAEVPDAETIDFSGESPGSWLLKHVPWTEARHRITAVGADAAAARRLGIARGHACLQLERWTWRAGAGVTFVRLLFPGDRFDLVARFAP